MKDIKKILDADNFDKKKAMEQQITLLTLKKEHLERLISFAREIQEKGEKRMDFTAFDTKKLDEYNRQAKEQWGKTEAYKEFEEKSKNRTKDTEKSIMEDFMKIFVTFGEMKDKNPNDAEVLEQVKKLQNYITEHFYNCTKEILAGLGKMYAAGGEFTENIDKAGGKGTAEFTAKAIEIYCGK